MDRVANNRRRVTVPRRQAPPTAALASADRCAASSRIPISVDTPGSPSYRGVPAQLRIVREGVLRGTETRRRQRQHQNRGSDEAIGEGEGAGRFVPARVAGAGIQVARSRTKSPARPHARDGGRGGRGRHGHAGRGAGAGGPGLGKGARAAHSGQRVRHALEVRGAREAPPDGRLRQPAELLGLEHDAAAPAARHRDPERPHLRAPPQRRAGHRPRQAHLRDPRDGAPAAQVFDGGPDEVPVGVALLLPRMLRQRPHGLARAQVGHRPADARPAVLRAVDRRPGRHAARGGGRPQGSPVGPRGGRRRRLARARSR